MTKKDALGAVATQVITFETTEVLNNQQEKIKGRRLTVLGRGAVAAADALSDKLDQPTLLAKNLPPVGTGLARAMSGGKGALPTGIEDLRAEVGAVGEEEEEGTQEGGGVPFLERLFETGLGALSLGEIGEDAEFSTPDLLRNALDALDATPNNVSFQELGLDTPSEDDDALLFDVGISKSLSGPTDLAIAADVLGGTVDLDGSIDISADLTLHVGLGVDEQGFYLQPLAGSAPEITFDHIRTNGETRAEGQLGFLGVTLTDGDIDDGPRSEDRREAVGPRHRCGGRQDPPDRARCGRGEARHHDGDRQSDGRRRNAERRSSRRGVRFGRGTGVRPRRRIDHLAVGGHRQSRRRGDRCDGRRSAGVSRLPQALGETTCWMGSRAVATTLQQVGRHGSCWRPSFRSSTRA